MYHNSSLPKLLAKENLTIRHGNYQTPWFDIKNRVLGLPLWKDMGKDVYDLFVGHEVGHALETPYEGWHDSPEKLQGCPRSYINVIEDARIERKVKTRYPGLVGPFSRAYANLFEDNFFGTDEFQYSVNVSEKNITRTGTATITVNSVDDPPILAFETVNDFSKNKMLFEDNQTFRLTVSDVDTSLDTLIFDVLIGEQSIDAVFTLDAVENTNGSGTLSLDLSSLQKAGLYTAQLRASDSANSAVSVLRLGLYLIKQQ